MKFNSTPFEGVYTIEIERIFDERGFFARSFCQKEFIKFGLNPNIKQCNISFNRKKGTLRGMHFQNPPFEEDKVVSCSRGAIYDVILDLRKTSNTYKQWISFELNEENNVFLYIPSGFAHGFQTLVDNAQVLYQMSEFYQPDYAQGVRYNDPMFPIQWPLDISVVSEKDLSYSDFIDK